MDAIYEYIIEKSSKDPFETKEWIIEKFLKSTADGWGNWSEQYNVLTYRKIKDAISNAIADKILSDNISIELLRNRIGLSQEEFADIYGIPLEIIQAWENDEQDIPQYVMNLICKVTGYYCMTM